MAWSEDLQNKIDATLATQLPSEVVVVAITRLIEAKIAVALYNCGIGGSPPCDPRQDVDYYERLLMAAITLFQVR